MDMIVWCLEGGEWTRLEEERASWSSGFGFLADFFYRLERLLFLLMSSSSMPSLLFTGELSWLSFSSVTSLIVSRAFFSVCSLSSSAAAASYSWSISASSEFTSDSLGDSLWSRFSSSPSSPEKTFWSDSGCYCLTGVFFFFFFGVLFFGECFLPWLYRTSSSTSPRELSLIFVLTSPSENCDEGPGWLVTFEAGGPSSSFSPSSLPWLLFKSFELFISCRLLEVGLMLLLF